MPPLENGWSQVLLYQTPMRLLWRFLVALKCQETSILQKPQKVKFCLRNCLLTVLFGFCPLLVVCLLVSQKIALNAIESGAVLPLTVVHYTCMHTTDELRCSLTVLWLSYTNTTTVNLKFSHGRYKMLCILEVILISIAQQNIISISFFA